MGQEDDVKNVLRPVREMLRQVRETTAVDTWQAIRRDVIAGLALAGAVASESRLNQFASFKDRAAFSLKAADALIAKLDENEKAPVKQG